MTRSDTYQAVQSQNLARGLKFWIWEVDELTYLCSENKGTDQMRDHCASDLRLCFRHGLVMSCFGYLRNIFGKASLLP